MGVTQQRLLCGGVWLVLGVALQSHGVGQAARLTPHGRLGKQQTAGGQNEARMTACCYNNVLLFTKNRMKSIILCLIFYINTPEINVAVKCSCVLILTRVHKEFEW